MATLALLIVVAVLTPPLPVAATTSSVRVTVPDVAGFLYPQQAQGRSARFASPSSTSLTPYYATQVTPSDSLPPCATPSALCLDIAWASQYQFDPFVLVAFESKTTVSSTTFDDDANTADLLPVIQGDQSGVPTGTTTRTLWQFALPLVATGWTSDTNHANRTIDVLFRLRQQSQLRAVRDQLLVHITVTRQDERTSQVAVETYAVYGNQRVDHQLLRISASHLRLDVDILRDASRADVVLQDAYPLVPIERDATDRSHFGWRITDNECRRCTALLLGCESPNDLESGVCTYATSTAEVPVCLRTVYGLTDAWFKIMLTNGLGTTLPLTPMFWGCLKGLFAREATGDQLPDKHSLSVNMTAALSCLAARQCPFGPLDEVFETTAVPTQMLQLVSPVAFTVQVEWPATETLSGYFEVVFGGGPDGDPTFMKTTDEVNDAGVETDVERVLQAVLDGMGYATVTATRRSQGASSLLDLEVKNLPHLYLFLNFVPTSSVSSVSITPTNDNGGTTLLRVAAFDATQLVLTSECDQCKSEFSACRDDDTCRLVVLPCVEQAFASLDVATASIDAVSGTYQVNFLSALAAKCFANVSVPSWNPIRRAIVCWSKHHCRLDATSTLSIDEQTFVRLANGTQVIAVPLEVAQDGSTMVQLVISHRGTRYPFHSAVETLAKFVRLFVLGNAADVVVQTEDYPANAELIQLRLTYANTLLSVTPSFSESVGVVVMEDTAPTGFVEFADTTAFSVDGARNIMRSSMNIWDDQVVGTNHPWILAPECLSCSAQLFGCTPNEVEGKTCLYDNATSRLAQCIRSTYSRAELMAILNAPVGHDGSMNARAITTDVTRCIQTATALAGDTLASRISITRTLSCFAETRCPFGPIDLVSSSRMVRLTTSTFVQSLRIPARHFRLDLVIYMGQHVLAQTAIADSTIFTYALAEALVPFGIAARADVSAAEGEWTVVMQFDNVVTSDFHVRIASSSVPGPHFIEQALLRPTTRLVVAPRLVTKVFLPSEVTENTTTTSPTPAPTESPFLPFTDECVQCDTVHLTACARSEYCRATIAPCFATYLNQHSVDEIAQTMPDGSTSIDLAFVLRSCVSSPSFFDWWEPIQRWLGCYAAARCPITRPEPSRTYDAFLEFVPATVEINASTTDMWSGMNGAYSVGSSREGSSLSWRSTTVGSIDQLREVLEHLTQGVSKVNLTSSELADPPETSINAVYEEPFFGDIEVAMNGYGISNIKTSVARLLVRSTTNSFSSSPWGILVDKLLYLYSPSQYQGCDGCASAYLPSCRNNPSCGGYLLECLTVSIDNHYASLLGGDRSLYQVFTGCARDLPLADWWPVQKYFTCLRDSQCVTFGMNDASSPPPSYLRLRSGHIRMVVDSVSPSSLHTIAVTVNETASYSPTTIPELRSVLQSLVGNSGDLEMQVKILADSNLNQVDFFLHDYIGKMPLIEYAGSEVDTWQPDIVVYSTASPLSTSRFTGDLYAGHYCNLLCTEPLERCVRGDSYTSLHCRYEALPCVSDVITVQVPSGVGVQSNGNKSVDFTDELRSCFSAFYSPMQPIAQFFGCLAAWPECTLNYPRSTSARTQLRFRPGEQVVSVGWNDPIVDIIAPLGVGESVPQSISATDVNYFKWRLNATVVKYLANVSVDEEMAPAPSPRRWTIQYDDYVGFLPSISGSGITLVNQSEPSVSISSTDPIDANQWNRLDEVFRNFTADKSSSCSSCAMNALMNCPVCTSTILPSLLMMLLHDTTTSSSPTFNLTDVFYTVVDTLPIADWLPVAQMLTCLMVNGCPVSSDSGSARPPSPSTTFLMLRSAKLALTLRKTTDGSPIVAGAVGAPPHHSIETLPPTTDVTYLSVDEWYGYPSNSAFQQNFRSLLNAGSQSPTITIAKRELDPALQQFVLDIEVRDFFGWLPRIVRSPDNSPRDTLVSAETVLPEIIGQTYGNVSGASVTGLVSMLQSFTAPSPPLPTKVPTGACADQCAKPFLGCELDVIASGQCSYTTSSTLFVTCLRQNLPPSVFYGVGRVFDTSYVFNAALQTCIEIVQTQDAVTGGASFRDDQWSIAIDSLACYDLLGCAFGPLTESLAFNNMIVLQSTSGIRTFTVASETFTGVFRSTMGWRIQDSTAFSESTLDEDLATLVSEILPRGEIMVSKTVLPDATGYTITVTYRAIYVPEFGLALDADGAVVTDDTGSVKTLAALRTVALDTTYLDNATS